jgi:putative zinc finger protein
MICPDAREHFSALVDEILTPEERAGLDAHLAECPECRKELERLQSTLALLHRLERPRAPAGFVDRVLGAARPERWHRRLLQRFFLPLSVKLPAEVAALLLVAGLAAYVFQRTPELQRQAREEQSRTVGPPETAAGAPAPAPPPTRAQAPPGERADRPSTPEAPDQGKSSGTLEDARRSLDKTLGSAALGGASKPSEPGLTPAPVPGREPGVEMKKETDTGRIAPAAPTEGRAESAKNEAERSTGPAAAHRSAVRALPSADVTGQLAVKDRAAAERALGEALTRAGGLLVARHEDAGTTVVEVSVPRTAYPEFTRALADLGVWRPESEPAELPPSIRVTLHLVD